MVAVIKIYLITLIIIVVCLITMALLDDSYEDAQLSAQVLDECIAQASEDQKEIDRAFWHK